MPLVASRAGVYFLAASVSLCYPMMSFCFTVRITVKIFVVSVAFKKTSSDGSPSLTPHYFWVLFIFFLFPEPNFYFICIRVNLSCGVMRSESYCGFMGNIDVELIPVNIIVLYSRITADTTRARVYYIFLLQ
jgi:hypothetical protein